MKKQDSRVVIYNDKNEDTEIAFRVSLKEAIKWGGFGLCDICNLVDSELYLCPELGHKAICKKCFKEHKKSVQWYVEDLHIVFNTIIQYVLNYDLKWTEVDLDLIDEFFASKKHYSLHIRKFIEENKTMEVEEKEDEDTFWDDVFKDLVEGLKNGKETR